MRWLVKILALLGVVIIVSMLTFLMTTLLPGKPAQVMAGVNADNPAIVARITKQHHLNDPLVVQYVHWAGGILHGNFGTTLSSTPQPVSSELRQTIPNTLQMLFLAELSAIVIAIPIGVYSGYRANGKADKVATGMAFFFLAVPAYVLAVVLIAALSVEIHLLPSSFTSIAVGGVWQSLKSSIMPAVCLMVGITPVYIRLLRTDMITTLQEDYILNARAKGLRPSYILFRHALRPSSFSLLTVAGISLGTAIGGSIIVESIFSINGVGNLLVNAISMRDYFTVQAIVLIISLTYVGANFIVDLLYSQLDPRIRRG